MTINKLWCNGMNTAIEWFSGLVRSILDIVKSEFLRGFYFHESLHVPSFVKIKLSQNGEITLQIADIGISCHSHKF